MKSDSKIGIISAVIIVGFVIVGISFIAVTPEQSVVGIVDKVNNLTYDEFQEDLAEMREEIHKETLLQKAMFVNDGNTLIYENRDAYECSESYVKSSCDTKLNDIKITPSK